VLNMSKMRVGVLMGGLSAERDVSLRTGAGVADALEERGQEVVRIAFGPETRGVDQLVREANIDVAFLALHGRGGEDGCIQGLLELLGIPYTGSSVLASALAMDKLKSKELFRLHNVPTAPYYVATKESLGDLAEVHASFGFPVIVKPRGEGSSVGVSRADDLVTLEESIRGALVHDDLVLIERFVRGMEVHVGVLDGRALGAIEVVPKSGVYDYASKYTPGATDYICPPRLGTTRARGVMNLAERAARHPSRDDQDLPAAQDRGIRGRRLRRALRGDSQGCRPLQPYPARGWGDAARDGGDVGRVCEAWEVCRAKGG
jgi:D-alanine-D-alanine ligase